MVNYYYRLKRYQPEESTATLSAQHSSIHHQVLIQTSFVEPFVPIIGAQYIVLGEIEHHEGNDFCITCDDNYGGRQSDMCITLTPDLPESEILYCHHPDN